MVTKKLRARKGHNHPYYQSKTGGPVYYDDEDKYSIRFEDKVREFNK